MDEKLHGGRLTNNTTKLQIDIKAGEKKSITRHSCGFAALHAIIDAELASTFLGDIENRRSINVRARNLHLSRHAKS